MPSSAEVFAKVQKILVDALGVEEDEVTSEAKIIGDLGAESIDFLDIIFNLEKSFGIEISRDQLFPDDIFTNDAYVQQGRVTPDGLKVMKERMPYIDLSKFEQDPKVQSFGGLLTVQDLCRYVEFKLS
jgi:acyl carrier protein